jgi:hypothetical protein
MISSWVKFKAFSQLGVVTKVLDYFQNSYKNITILFNVLFKKIDPWQNENHFNSCCLKMKPVTRTGTGVHGLLVLS